MVFLSVSWVVLAITGRAARWVDTAKPASAHEARPKITKRVGIICLYIVCPPSLSLGWGQRYLVALCGPAEGPRRRFGEAAMASLVLIRSLGTPNRWRGEVIAGSSRPR
jgi:hypothetical protein